MILGEVGSQIAVDLQAQGEDAVRLEVSQGMYLMPIYT